MEDNEINEKFWFNSHSNKNISELKIGLGKYIENFDKATKLEEYPIFLDTNVLLFFYKVSSKVKSNFIEFLSKNIENIYITEHVKNEFLKSRTKVINEGYLKVVSNVPKELKKQLNKFTSFINSNKSILEDFDETYLQLKETESNLSKIHSKLDNEITTSLDKNKNIKYNDALLDEYSKIKVINNLTEKEIVFLKEKYKLLIKTSKIVFPGMADEKGKIDNVDGDFIIFHEIMKYMKTNKSNVIFLTNDIKKDWFEIDENGNRNPQISYIESTYNNTKQFNYILDANRTLSDILNIQIKSYSYLRKLEKQNEILKHKSFYIDWSAEEFTRILNDDYLEHFSHPVSEITLEFDVELSNLDFDQLLEDNSTLAKFEGEGIAHNKSKDTSDKEVIIKTLFYFNGTCIVDTENKIILIEDMNIEENETVLENVETSANAILSA